VVQEHGKVEGVQVQEHGKVEGAMVQEYHSAEVQEQYMVE